MKIYGKLRTNNQLQSKKKDEKMAVDWPYLKKTHWIHKEVGIGLEPSGGSVVPKRPGKGRLSMKPWKQRRHGARLKDWLLTEPSGGVSRIPYAPDGATVIKKCYCVCSAHGMHKESNYQCVKCRVGLCV
jgi:hypothetical protein